MFSRFLLSRSLWLVIALSSSFAMATELQGLATYTHLNEPLYIAGVYAESGQNSPEKWLQGKGTRTMEFRFVAERVSPRTFARVFLERVLVNNPGATEAYQEDMQTILMFVRQEYQRADNLKFVASGDSVRLIINGVEQTNIEHQGLFNLILNAWIGERLSGQSFYRDLTGSIQDNLLSEYNVLIASEARQGWAEQLASRLGGVPVSEPVTAVAQKQSPVVNPPRSATTKPTVAQAKPQQKPTTTPLETRKQPEVKPAVVETKPTPKPKAKPRSTPPQQVASIEKTPNTKSQANALSPLLVDLRDDYLAELKSSIENKAAPRPPRTVRKISKEDLVAEVTVNADGQVVTVNYRGDEFDEAVLAAVTEELQRLTTLPKAPEVLPLKEYTVTTSFSFAKCKRPTSVWICF